MPATAAKSVPPFGEMLERAIFSSSAGQPTVEYTPHAGQRLLLDSQARFRVLVAHRRAGKNWACIWDAWEKINRLRQQARPLLNPKVVIWFVFPTYPLASELWSDWKRFVPESEVIRKLESKPYLMDLHGDVHIELRSAENPDDLVSAGIDALYMIEAARMKEAAWLNVRPTLVSEGRYGHVVFNSTPKGGNWFARLYQTSQDALFPEWQGWRIPAFDADGQRNVYSKIPSTERLQEEKRNYPERWWRQEYLAEFLTGEGAVFRNVRERIASAPSPPKQPLVCGVDLAKHSDFSVFSVFDADGCMVEIERLREASYSIQAERLISLLGRLGVRKCVIESNGPGEPFYDMILTELHHRRQEMPRQPEIVPFATTAQSKRQMIDALVIAFEQGKVTLLPDEELVNEFEAFEMTEGKTGNIRFAAPEGGFDDRVMACALAWTSMPRPATAHLHDGMYKGLKNFKPFKKTPYGAGLGVDMRRDFGRR